MVRNTDLSGVSFEFSSSAAPSDAQIVSYYASNSAQYNKDEQVCARHILKKFAKPGDEKSEQPPKEFLALKPTTANFAKLAEKNSDDPGSKEKGGDLDCFPKSAMDKAFAETAFSTAVGTISMDNLTVALGPDCPPEIAPEATVTLIGRDGAQRQRVEDLAHAMDSIPHEVLCGLSHRVIREYHRDGEPVG